MRKYQNDKGREKLNHFRPACSSVRDACLKLCDFISYRSVKLAKARAKRNFSSTSGLLTAVVSLFLGEKNKIKQNQINRSLCFILLLTKFIMLEFVPMRDTRSLAYFYILLPFQIHPLDAEVALHAVLTISITSRSAPRLLTVGSRAHTGLIQYETFSVQNLNHFIAKQHGKSTDLKNSYRSSSFHHSQGTSSYTWTSLLSLGPLLVPNF